MKAIFDIIVVIAGWLLHADAFVYTTPTTPMECWTLWAKKGGGKKGKAKQGAAGGFGTTKEKIKSSTKSQSDFAAFPALEDSVKDTLVPSPADWALEAGGLPAEIYDRLDQIYGFPNFNFENGSQESAQDDMSLESLLSFPAATVGDAASSGSKEQRSPEEMAINNLPPFEKFRILHVDPMVLAVDDFFSGEECDRYVGLATQSSTDAVQTRSKTVGKDSLAQAQRTSTTWFHHYTAVPEFMAKASRLLGLPGIDRWEEPQIVRYRGGEKFTWHLDALSPNDQTLAKGGQRTATLLVYLTNLADDEGGATMFRDLGGEAGSHLKVRPKKGSALLFFPAAGGVSGSPFDIRTLHCGEAVTQTSPVDKWIGQLWLRESPYSPTAPPGNSHPAAKDAIDDYCQSFA